MNRIARALGVTFICILCCGTGLEETSRAAVFLSPDKPRLAPDSGGRVTLHLGADSPSIGDKTDYADGAYAESSDDALFQILVRDALALWNAVPGIAIRLELAATRDGVADPEDGLHSLGLATDLPVTVAAQARPIIRGARIDDCDIQVGSAPDSAAELAVTIAHEIGHCLGLGHNHIDGKSLMSYARTDRRLSLGLDDMAGMIALYPADASAKKQAFAPCGVVAASPRGARTRTRFIDGLSTILLFLPVACVLLVKRRRT